MNSATKLPYIACLLLFLVASAGAREAHVHGQAELSLAMEEGALLIELHSPAANLLGFEHAPRSRAEHDTLAATREKLEEARNLLILHGGDCALKETMVDLGPVEPPKREPARNHESGHSEHGHSEHGHPDHEHSEQGHSEQGHSEHDHLSHGQHGDAVISYTYHCQNPRSLSRIELTAFDVFPGFARIRGTWVINGRQAAARLTPSQPFIDVK